jgi:predicted metal-dependent phosphoesterase TrpH
MTKKYDLHSHSSLSDGVLSPKELVYRAQLQGVDVLALTDHDTTAGYEEANTAANYVGIDLIPGIEFMSWAWGSILTICRC